MKSEGDILIVGARQHNLKNITVRIPRNSLTVITGLSGSGKSSLAFDTLYAEGQRRYVESLSAYARQFLDQMQKPDVDRIDSLSPAIAMEQRTGGSNPRSIVATSTEIHDYLRLLFAHIGRPHCPKCHRPVGRQSAEQIVNRLLALPGRTRVHLLAPVVKGKKGSHVEIFNEARKSGFVRARVDGNICDLDDLPSLDRNKQHNIEIVVDRLIVTDKIRPRLADSVETSLRHGNGICIALFQTEGSDKWEEILFSEKNACPDCGISFAELKPHSFSFNSPYGACQTCGGLGTQLIFDEDLIVPDRNLSLTDGAIKAWRRGGRRLILHYKSLLRSVARHYGANMDCPYKDLPSDFVRILMYGSGDEAIECGYWRSGIYHRYWKPFEGVIPNLQRRYGTTGSEYVREYLRDFMSKQPCPECRGTRLRPEALACTIANKSIADVIRMSVGEAANFFCHLSLTKHEAAVAGEVLREIRKRLGFLEEVGLSYLTLDRESGTLSGGEAQRIRLATQIGSGLVGVIYVLDEPTIGLHVRDTERLISSLLRLRDLGNTVVVVEHDAYTISRADHVIDLGPGAGRLGGNVVAQGTPTEIISSAASLTGKYLSGQLEIPRPNHRRTSDQGELVVICASENNLKNIDVAFPLGLLICVTGVSGSGKSTLVDEILRKALFRHLYRARERPGKHKKILGIEKIDKAVVIDQSPIGRTPRSNPATYTGAFTFIRSLFASVPAAKVRGYGPGRFSFNVKGGRCETCKGDGILKLEMHFLPDVYVPCEQCRGMRFNSETLEIRYNGRNIADVLNMTVDEALEFFGTVPAIERKLKTLSDVGLGYLQLGQPATTLSGGEAQRIKLSAELSRKATGRTIYLLDEPTTGLHFADIHRLVCVLQKLRDAGNTIVVIEHNIDVIKTADYVIDLGPEGGEGGGEVVAAGTPEQIAACERSHTGRYLRQVLKCF